MLLAKRGDGAVFLTQRPATGVWAGLYCLPSFGTLDDLLGFVPKRLQSALNEGATFKHVLTHKDMHIHPLYLNLAAKAQLIDHMGFGNSQGRWVESGEWPKLGLPAPVRNLLLVA